MRRTFEALRFALGALVVVGLVPATSPAQTPPEEGPVGSLRAGDWALQFQIEENFTLTSFDGLMISVERHWSPRSALRLGVDLRIVTEDGDTRTDTGDTLGSSIRTQEDNGNFEGFALRMQYVAYSNPDGRVHFFWAAGPRLSYNRSHDERVSVYSTAALSTKSVDAADSDAWGAALAGAIGIQCFAARGIGLLAEYGASAGYLYEKRTADRTYEATGSPVLRSGEESEQRGFRFDSLGVRLGVSLHF